jgi:hypothetical protein
MTSETELAQKQHVDYISKDDLIKSVEHLRVDSNSCARDIIERDIAQRWARLYERGFIAKDRLLSEINKLAPQNAAFAFIDLHIRSMIDDETLLQLIEIKFAEIINNTDVRSASYSWFTYLYGQQIIDYSTMAARLGFSK